MKIKNFFLFILLTICVASCKSKPAPIINNSQKFYKKGISYNKGKYIVEDLSDGEAIKKISKENITEKSLPKITDSAVSKIEPTKDLPLQDKNQSFLNKVQGNKIEVLEGDTLYSIARKYNTPMRDIIEQNDLSAPYILKRGDKIIIPKPSYHEVKKGETLYSISRLYNMNVDAVVALNDLKAPYSVIIGQKIKVKNLTENDKKEVILAKNNENLSKNDQKTTENAQNSKNAQNENPAHKVEKKTLSAVETILSEKNNRFIWPIKGPVISKFGPKKGGLYNDGINIKSKEGNVVKAAEDGVVAYVGNELKGYGNLIIIKHSGGWITAYAHLASANVKRGQKVEKLQNIALVGSTGNVDNPQLYFGLRKGREAVNPEFYLK